MKTYNSTLLSYPCFIQPKLNGVFATLCDGVLVSKGNKYYPALGKDWPSTGGMKFAGELYHHDWRLQRILGAVNRDTPNKDSHEIQFWIHDLLEPKPVYKRIELIERFAPLDHPRIRRVWSTKIYSAEEGDREHIRHMDMRYEGSVYKLYNSLPNDTFGAYKRKDAYDAEFICLSVIEGKGKRTGHVGAFVCKNYDGTTFHVGGGQVSYETLRELFLHPPIGKRLTVRFHNTSEAGIPLCGQFIAVRDYE